MRYVLQNPMRTRVMLWTLTLSIASFGFSTLVGAATIADYDVANANAATSPTVNVASTDPNVSAATMTAQGALGAPFNNPQTFCYQGHPTGALDNTKYYEWSITPNAGFEITYSSIDLAVASGGSGTGSFEIHASTDGFVSSQNYVFQNFPCDATWHAYNRSLVALGTHTGTVAFRLYIYNVPASGFSGLGVDPTFGSNGRNLTVNGDVRSLTVGVEAATWSGVKAVYLDR